MYLFRDYSSENKAVLAAGQGVSSQQQDPVRCGSCHRAQKLDTLVLSSASKQLSAHPILIPRDDICGVINRQKSSKMCVCRFSTASVLFL